MYTLEHCVCVLHATVLPKSTDKKQCSDDPRDMPSLGGQGGQSRSTLNSLLHIRGFVDCPTNGY